MKLAALALLLLFGFPIGLYILVGKEAFNDANIVLGMLGVGAVLFIMGCLFTAKNVLSTFFDFLLITMGGFLLLIGAFARPLGLFEGEEGQNIEQRIMQQEAPPIKEPAPVQPIVNNETQPENDPSRTIDEIVGVEPDPERPPQQNAEDAEPEQKEPKPVHKPKQNEKPKPESPVEPDQKDTEPKEGLELFKEESGQE